MRPLLLFAVVAVGAAAAPSAPGRGGAEPPVRLRVQAAADTAALNRLLGAVRGAEPLYCELVVRSVDGRVWWNSSGAQAGGPLEVDSSAAALIRWIHSEHGDARMVPRLASAMRDADPCVRRVAGSMLGRVRHPTAAAALLSALEHDDPATRTAAAVGLGIAEHRAALQPLVARLRDPSPAVRRTAAWALGELEMHEAMLPLIELLGRDGDARVRQAVATAIPKVTR